MFCVCQFIAEPQWANNIKKYMQQTNLSVCKPSPKNLVCLGFCVATWLPLSLRTSFRSSGGQLYLPLSFSLYRTALAVTAQAQKRSSIKTSVVLSRLSVWRDLRTTEEKRCWGEGLPMPRRRSRCRRRRWAEVLVMSVFWSWGEVNVLSVSFNTCKYYHLWLCWDHYHTLEAMDVCATLLHTAVIVCTFFQHRMSAEVQSVVVRLNTRTSAQNKKASLRVLNRIIFKCLV